jgi:hypothetical protein
MNIVLEDVRSFRLQQSIPLRPLTLLVGDNSSGKTTFMAVAASVLDPGRFPRTLGFNDPPYTLGSYETIATNLGRNRIAKAFTIGFTSGDKGSPGYQETLAAYGNESGNPVIRALNTSNQHGNLNLSFAGVEVKGTITYKPKGRKVPRVIEVNDKLEPPGREGPRFLELTLITALMKDVARTARETSAKPQTSQESQPEKVRVSIDNITEVMEVLGAMTPSGPRPFSLAPIRSRPKRTYDEFSEAYSPEGDHVPSLVAKLFRDSKTAPEAAAVRSALVRFGRESGLFKRVNVKSLGKHASDPFQIQVGFGGPTFNLMDVGYGVSQALPVVVQTTLKKDGAILVQQPEVHLHPRAQAALGSYLAELTAGSERMFVVETHSDFLVDRVRQEVARCTLAPEKVIILFFHKEDLETTVYPIRLDSEGNVEDAPECYREFFLEEEFKLLQRTSG